METIAKIRRAYFSQKKTIKEICRDVRKALRRRNEYLKYFLILFVIPLALAIQFFANRWNGHLFR